MKKIIEKNKKVDFYWDIAELASGIGLALFFFSHMFNDSTIILGEWAFNGVAHIMEVLYLEQLMFIAVPSLIIFHVIVAGRRIPSHLADMKVMQKHFKEVKHKSTRLWAFQVVSGVAIGFLATAHFWTIFSSGPISAQASAARIKQGPFFILYLLLIGFTSIHTGLGLYRQGVKWVSIDRGFLTHVLRVVTGGIIILSLVSFARFYFL
ncbi:MAG: hypothetical protein ABIJ24_00730 [Nitrospinota bacterium]